MHPNQAFHTATNAENVAWARERAFGNLAVGGDGAPLVSHVPFLLDETGGVAELHLVRSNPIARALGQGPLAARLAVSGPDAYISPDWYGDPGQVPTWNYVAVHLTGQLQRLPDTALRGLLERQTAFFEDLLAPKPPWTLDKMPGDALDKMMRAIVPARLVIETIDGTWKLNQNKPDEMRLRAADHVEASGHGAEVAILAALMRGA